jgi:hypothetical protein
MGYPVPDNYRAKRQLGDIDRAGMPAMLKAGLRPAGFDSRDRSASESARCLLLTSRQRCAITEGRLVNDTMHSRLTVDKVSYCLLRHPYRHVFRRWNWKSAFLSAFFRGILIFCVNLSTGGVNATSAMLAEICYRSLTSGFCSSIVQSFRYVRPVWAATITSLTLVPVMCDLIEFLMHKARGTQMLGATMAASAVFTLFSVLIELFIMRHGILVIGHNSNSLLEDLRKIPALMMEFVCSCTRMSPAPLFSIKQKKQKSVSRRYGEYRIKGRPHSEKLY